MEETVGKCVSCGRTVRWTPWASGPVCYPCYWAAKLIHESGIEAVEDVPEALRPELAKLFDKGGYAWPADLQWALTMRPFDRCDVDARRWWSPRPPQYAMKGDSDAE